MVGSAPRLLLVVQMLGVAVSQAGCFSQRVGQLTCIIVLLMRGDVLLHCTTRFKTITKWCRALAARSVFF